MAETEPSTFTFPPLLDTIFYYRTVTQGVYSVQVIMTHISAYSAIVTFPTKTSCKNPIRIFLGSRISGFLQISPLHFCRIPAGLL